MSREVTSELGFQVLVRCTMEPPHRALTGTGTTAHLAKRSRRGGPPLQQPPQLSPASHRQSLSPSCPLLAARPCLAGCGANKPGGVELPVREGRRDHNTDGMLASTPLVPRAVTLVFLTANQQKHCAGLSAEQSVGYPYSRDQLMDKNGRLADFCTVQMGL